MKKNSKMKWRKKKIENVYVSGFLKIPFLFLPQIFEKRR